MIRDFKLFAILNVSDISSEAIKVIKSTLVNLQLLVSISWKHPDVGVQQIKVICILCNGGKRTF